MMFKTLFFTLWISIGSQALAGVNVRWLTVASIVIDDGKTKILFDPAWTRPTWKHWLNLELFKSDEHLVQEVLQKNEMTKIEAIFSSHSHFDHVVDAPMVSKLTGATFYTDEHSEKIAKAYADPKIKTLLIKNLTPVKIGAFIVTPIVREHAKLLGCFDFLPGDVPNDIDLSFYDYREGESWFYLIEHPLGNILIDQAPKPNADALKKLTQRVDVLIQGIASRENDEQIIEGHSKTYRPEIFIPLHFDNFFLQFNEGAETEMFGMNIDDVIRKLKKAYPLMKVNRPSYGKAYEVLKGN